jgi:hypothetical protein
MSAVGIIACGGPNQDDAGLVVSRTPWFDPARRLPTPWAVGWMTAYDEGSDMRRYFESAASAA